jgi:hypothetical protein
MIGVSRTFRPREAGEGDHAKRGGGGFGRQAWSRVKTCPLRRAEPVIGPAEGRTRWLASAPASGGGKRESA